MAVSRYVEIEYNQGTLPFVLDDYVIGETSGTLGVVVKIRGATNVGDLYLVPHLDEEMGEFVEGENLLVNNVTKAKVFAVSNIYTQSVVQVGANSPFNKQHIDSVGASFVRFAEGSQQFDAFGATKVSQNTTLADYLHDVEDESNLWSVATISGGTRTYLSTESAVILSTDGTATSRCTQTTHRYHHYFPGTGNLIEMTVSCGDTGKTNNKRRWGYFDDDDGLFFQLSDTGLSVVRRYSVTGPVIEEVVPQVDWNHDRADGTDTSLINIDVTKVNIWWIDYQWLGSGRVRMGIISPNGERIVCHHFESANLRDRAYMRTGSLPLRIENINSGIVGSSAEMRFQAASVKVEGALEPYFSNYADPGNGGIAVTSLRPVASIRPAVQFRFKTNRTHIQPQSISVYVSGGPALCHVIENTTLTGATFPTQVGAVEVDNAATVATGGKTVKTVMLAIGTHEIDLRMVYDYMSDGLRLNADNTQTQCLSLVCDVLAGSTPTVYAAFNWQQLS